MKGGARRRRGSRRERRLREEEAEVRVRVRERVEVGLVGVAGRARGVCRRCIRGALHAMATAHSLDLT